MAFDKLTEKLTAAGKNILVELISTSEFRVENAEKIAEIAVILKRFPTLITENITAPNGATDTLANLAYRLGNYELCREIDKNFEEITFSKDRFKDDARVALIEMIENDTNHVEINGTGIYLSNIISFFPELTKKPILLKDGRETYAFNYAIEIGNTEFMVEERHSGFLAEIEGIDQIINGSVLYSSMRGGASSRESGGRMPDEIFMIPLPNPYGEPALLLDIVLQNRGNASELLSDYRNDKASITIDGSIVTDIEEIKGYCALIAAIGYTQDVNEYVRILKENPTFANLQIPHLGKKYDYDGELSPLALAILSHNKSTIPALINAGALLTDDEKNRTFTETRLKINGEEYEKYNASFNLLEKAKAIFSGEAHELYDETPVIMSELAVIFPELYDTPLEKYHYIDSDHEQRYARRTELKTTEVFPASQCLMTKDWQKVITMIEGGGRISISQTDSPFDHETSEAFGAFLTELTLKTPDLVKIDRLFTDYPELTKTPVGMFFMHDPKDAYNDEKSILITAPLINWLMEFFPDKSEIAVIAARHGSEMYNNARDFLPSPPSPVQVEADFVKEATKLRQAIRDDNVEAAKIYIQERPELLLVPIFVNEGNRFDHRIVDYIKGHSDEMNIEISAGYAAIENKTSSKNDTRPREIALEEFHKASGFKNDEVFNYYARLMVYEGGDPDRLSGSKGNRPIPQAFTDQGAITEEYRAFAAVLQKTTIVANATGIEFAQIADNMRDKKGTWANLNKELTGYSIRQCQNVTDTVREITRYLVLPAAIEVLGEKWLKELPITPNGIETSLTPVVAEQLFGQRELHQILGLSEIWHTHRNAAIDKIRDVLPEGEWPSLLAKPFVRNGYKIVDLTNTAELEAEGDALDHCVGGYFDDCLDSKCQIWGIKKGQEHISTVEITVEKGHQTDDSPNIINIPNTKGNSEYHIVIATHEGMSRNTPPKESYEILTKLKKAIESGVEIGKDGNLLKLNQMKSLAGRESREDRENNYIDSFGWDPSKTSLQDFRDRTWEALTMPHLRTNRRVSLIPSELKRHGLDEALSQSGIAEALINSCLTYAELRGRPITGHASTNSRIADAVKSARKNEQENEKVFTRG